MNKKLIKIIRELNDTKTIKKDTGTIDPRGEGNVVIDVKSWFTLDDLAEKIREYLDIRESTSQIKELIETKSLNDKELKVEYEIFKDKHEQNLYSFGLETKNTVIIQAIEEKRYNTFGSNQLPDIRFVLNKGNKND